MSTRDEEPRYLERLVRALRGTARDITPWFVKAMPEAYFRDTDEDTVVAHLAAVVAARIAGASPRMLLRDEERETWTFIQETSYRGLLSDLLAQLPQGRPLASAQVHTAADGSLILDVFRFGEAPRCDLARPELAAKLEEALAYARGLGDEEAPAELPRYLERSSADFVRAASPLRIHENWQLVRAVEGTDEVAISVSLQRESGLTRISVAAGNADTQGLFERIVNHLGRRRLDIARAFLDVFDGERGWVSSLGFVVHDPEGELLDGTGPTWQALSGDMARLAWIDDQVLTFLGRHPEETLDEAEALVVLIRLVHARLARIDPHLHARDRLLGHLDPHPSLALAIARLFLARFHPEGPLSASEVADRARAIADGVIREVEAEPGRQAFDLLLEGALAVTRTNAFVRGRASLAVRVDPAFFGTSPGRQTPRAVTFVHGRGMDAFHVRFADIARGGVRVVRPTTEDQYVVEAERLYEDAYNLAQEQELKNKDIPEGGAKAVVLLAPDQPVDRAVRAFVDALLDLSLEGVPGMGSAGLEVDVPLYLGPDENVSQALVDWAVARAEARRHPRPGTLMSSKSEAGIDHRAYGVTGEGVAVFLEEALRTVGIDPDREDFTLKMTGGPEGSLAGSLLRILHRDHGARAKVVGVADGTGTAWDPAGLDHAELLRLVEAGEGIAAFDPGRLGPEGGVLGLDGVEGPIRRNALAFEVEADAFVPAGGRSATLHAGNWRRFLKDGRPTSRVIVEGASQFITPEARTALSEAGVLIVKDSSANKCGVICSSLEIAAGLLLTPEELARHGPRLVDEVLARLRTLAREEARRLMGDHARNPSVALPDRSERLSKAILRATDAVEAVLRALAPAERAELDQVVEAFLPPVLVEVAGERIHDRLPARYRDRMVATRLAAQLVYREGVEVLDAFPDPAALGAAAIRYHRHGEEARALAAQVRAAGLPDAERMAALLEAGAPRAALFGSTDVTG